MFHMHMINKRTKNHSQCELIDELIHWLHYMTTQGGCVANKPEGQSAEISGEQKEQEAPYDLQADGADMKFMVAVWQW